MRALEEREKALNMHIHEGIGYKGINKITGIPLDTVKSWSRRYAIAHDVTGKGDISVPKAPIKKEALHIIKPRDPNTQEARIARLEMEVELLRNFLILTEER